ncbi:MAG: P-loop NTPase fold protein [Deltaproteobacteria bacterium]|nr:P-loop NTPase fold protein [Deltaproteobacteria bacterium]MCL5277616.1 P-loop NTPase fold protein [Deltaproteobacteria bacterium]
MAQMKQSNQQNYYRIDAPIVDPKLDRFKRLAFAQRIAETIASRKNPKSIVIGINGTWGAGKTTVLNFIEGALGKYPHIICVKFNPWRFNDEVHLLMNFFQTLSDAIGRSISSKEKIGKLFQQYISLILSVASEKVGKAVDKIGEILSTVSLDEIKKRVEKILKDEKKRVVILMDDIDRLDKTEIQTIFKLIKLSADFDYIAYVLAFDEEEVAKSLAEKYGSGNPEDGQKFLEKIIQVPLHLPKADIISLRKFCFECIQDAVASPGIALTENQTRIFVKHFIDGLEIRLHTPRMAIRYGNSLTFSLPILKGEVHPIDLMLIEGIRIFYPLLYNSILNNPKVFLDIENNSHVTDKKADEHSLKIIDQGLEGLTTKESEAAKDLLLVLFPRLNRLFGTTHYGTEWEDKWAEEQRISSRQYFDQFFSYTVLERNISDQELEVFFKQAESESVDSLILHIKKIVNDQNADSLILKLRRKEKQILPEISRKLALAIANCGDKFPNPEIAFSFTTAFSQAGILVRHLIMNIPKDMKRHDIGKIVVQEGQPFSFALECFKWMRSPDEKEEQKRLFSIEEENELGKLIASRIKEMSQEASPLYIRFPKELSAILYAWSTWGSKDEAKQYITETINKDSRNVLLLLKCYLPISWDLTGPAAGVPFKYAFPRESYNLVTESVDADLIYKTLYKIYGENLNSSKFITESSSLEEQVAHEFVSIFQQITSEEQKNIQNKDKH